LSHTSQFLGSKTAPKVANSLKNRESAKSLPNYEG
jgi:hypothetical protein